MLLIWRRWRDWRRGRPFWGGLFTVIAGVEIGVLPLAPMKVMLHQGTAGIPTVVLAAIMVVLGLTGLFTPQYRGLAGVVTVILAAAALVMSNLGGFLIGTLLGVVGGALMFAWRPVPAEADGDRAEGGADGRADGHGAGAAGAVPAQQAAFRSEAPEPSRAGAEKAGAAAPPASGSPASGAAGPAFREKSAVNESATGDGSLAAAFGVDDEPFPPPHGSAGPRD